MRMVVAAVVAVASCKDRAAPSPAPVAPVAIPETLAPGQKLGFGDFWMIAGVTRTDTPETLIQKWGKPDQRGDNGDGDDLVRYVYGPAVTFRADHAIQIDVEMFGDSQLPFAKAHPDAKLALLGMPCTEAAEHLAFTDKLGRSTTCTHYDANGWMVDVNLICDSKVAGLAIVWSPLADVRGHQLPADHCGDLPK